MLDGIFIVTFVTIYFVTAVLQLLAPVSTNEDKITTTK